ncbi:hypothetical protein COV15_02985 [Candidatus Woesearchaeota archaeon CG10_big_fil_rev_8_21_14_0_10_34_12]|nr:MAG: hypothetical protein COV15_02985 [Candidatus Woesearchaeota archaeon CG10_big_fil_rev_8_21_14_0_10_34_12]
MEESKLTKITTVLFQIFLFAFLILLLAREFYPDFLSFINAFWFMIFLVGLFVLMMIWNGEKFEDLDSEGLDPYNLSMGEKKKISLKDFAMIVFFGILGGALLFIKFKNFGWLSYVLAAFGGIFIIILSWMMLTEQN